MITEKLFGYNYAADFQKFGDESWMVYDEIVGALNAYSLRYPGGSTAELWIDLSNPNQSFYYNASGVKKDLTTVADYIEFCVENNYQAEIIIPTVSLLTSGARGTRTFDASKTAILENYIRHCLDVAGADAIWKFALGNEFESYMNNNEYARLVDAVVPIINRVLAEYSGADQYGNAYGPIISIQSYIFNAQASLSSDELLQRNTSLINWVSQSTKNLIDNVEGHYYFTNGLGLNLPEAHTYENISNSVNLAYRMLAQWEDLSGGRITSSISEWNVSHTVSGYTGLAQIAPLISIFSAFAENGADAMSFWSVMNQTTSTGLSNGSLTAAGAMLAWMREHLIGLDVSTAYSNANIVRGKGDVFTFRSLERTVIIFTSMSVDAAAFRVDFLDDAFGYTLVDAEILDVDRSKLDGVYKTTTNLPYYLESDVPAYFSDVDESDYLSETLITVGGFQTLAIELSSDVAKYFYFFSGNDSVAGVAGTKAYSLGGGADTFQGSSSSDTVAGGSGGDSLYGLDGNDYIIGGSGADTINGGAGADTILGGDDDDQVWGMYGADFISGGNGNDSLYGVADDDFIFGNAGSDLLSGGPGVDRILGGDDSDIIYGDSERDYLDGGSGNDTVFGGSGSDIMTGKVGSDQIDGQSGDDYLFGNAGNDTLNGGDGSDALFGGVDNDYLAGGNGYDLLRGGTGVDTLLGGADNDYLEGEEDNDILIGDDGNDTLYGGPGNDTLTGNSGSDFFVFWSTVSPADGERDTVTDFNTSLDILSFAGSGLSLAGASAFHDAAGSIRWSQSGGGVELAVDWDGDLIQDFTVFLSGVSSIRDYNFIL